ncbi:ABC transporter ATP-binding protein [Phycisphaeraceae bacterium AH-315-B13]|nr:ABC transporter ATP-binding protein [Phycisphaeraceae bacterium AH-315-B13]PHQ81884.1 MAG: ABC transporter [Phycisphaera sp.]
MTTTSQPPAIETIAISKIYGSGNTEVIALHEASMTIKRGEVVALLGPSGSGKSTLLSAIGLINPPTSGQILIDGKVVMDGPKSFVDLQRYRRERLGFIFQKSNLIPFLSALENVLISLSISGVEGRPAKQRAMELLDSLGVADRAKNLPAALSGGQQQRVAVARALANTPSLLLADEPTAALDSKLGRQVMELFREIGHKNQAGVLVVTHDQRALDVFDRTLHLEDGVLTEHDASEAAHLPNH